MNRFSFSCEFDIFEKLNGTSQVAFCVAEIKGKLGHLNPLPPGKLTLTRFSCVLWALV